MAAATGVGGVPAAHAAPPAPFIQVSVVLDHTDGSQEPVGTTQKFYPTDFAGPAALPQDASGGYYTTPPPARVPFLQGRTGVSIRALIGVMQVDVATVSTVDVSASSGGAGTLVAALHDLEPPAASDFPFESAAQPFVTFDDGPAQDLIVAVGARPVAPSAPTILDGRALDAVPGQFLALVVHTTTPVLRPTVTVPSGVVAGTGATFSAELDGSHPAATWAWDFGDGTPEQNGAIVRHTFATGGRPVGSVKVTDGGLSGVAGFVVDVKSSLTAPPSTTPPPGRTGGAGGTTAPNVGPIQGSGARVGGVPTDRPGGGRAGTTYDPRSATPSASGSSTGAPPLGGLVGYVLSDPDQPLPQQAQAAATPRDDSAPALRAGRTVRHVGTWVLATAVVVALLLIGAGRERRRPSHARARRRPTRRAP